MNPEIKSKWVAALRSGEFKQGKGVLRSADNSYCCLGVLCELYLREHPGLAEWKLVSHRFELQIGIVTTSTAILSSPVVNWSEVPDRQGVSMDGGHTLATLNDYGKTFNEIADVIEAQL